MPSSFFPDSTSVETTATSKTDTAENVKEAVMSPAPGASGMPSTTRRTLVAIAASTPVLAAAATLLSRRQPVAVVLPETPAKNAPLESAAYHETDHIRRYYRSAKYF